MSGFFFKEYPTLSDGEIELRIARLAAGNPEKALVPAYNFGIYLKNRPQRIGLIDIRIGYTNHLVWYGGHIGYGIEAPYRGRHYAGKACLLLKPVAQDHGMDVLWITCNPDNWASRKTCEYVGASLIDIVDLPVDTDMYEAGERQKCRYRWIIY